MSIFDNRRSMTSTLVVLNIAVFMMTYFIPRSIFYLALSPYGLLQQGWIWTPLTYMFAHGGFTHLLFNMVFLIFVAPSVESRMGTREFTVYYLVSGILAGLFSVISYMATGSNIPIVGASGALYATLLAFATYFPRVRLMVFYIIPMRAPTAMAVFAGIDLFLHLKGSGGVAHLTHLSGLAFGFLYFMIRLGINPVKEMRRGY